MFCPTVPATELPPTGADTHDLLAGGAYSFRGLGTAEIGLFGQEVLNTRDVVDQGRSAPGRPGARLRRRRFALPGRRLAVLDPRRPPRRAPEGAAHQGALPTLETDAHWRGSDVVGVEKAGDGSVSIERGCDAQSRKSTGRAHFVAGILSAHPVDALEIRALIGTQRGGIKGVGGICREFPEFSGARLERVGRHPLGGG